MQSVFVEPIAKALNEKHREMAAGDLRCAAQRSGFLSDDGIYNSRLEEMSSRLEKLRVGL